MKKRILGGLLCLLMLLSMVAGIAIPTAAAEPKHYFVHTEKEWIAAAGETTAGYWDNTIIHIEANLDFTGKSVPMFYNGEEFTGVIDGNGYTFSNITMETSEQHLGLVYCLKGTIKNLTISNSSFTINHNSARGGAFAATTSGGAVIYKCAANNVTVEANKGDHLGGMIGTCTSGIKMDSCFFNGTVTSKNETSGAASALIGYGGAQARVYNSIALGTVSGTATGMVRVHANSFGNVASMPIYNSYCVGMNVANYNDTPSKFEVAGSTVNGHAYSAEGLEANYKADSAAQAAWVVNKNRVDTGLERTYFTVGSSGDLRFGHVKDQAVKLTVINGDTTTVSYKGTGDEITLDTITGESPTAEGGLLDAHLLYVDTSDITVTYMDASAYNLASYRRKLQAMVGAYEQMNPEYFRNWSDIESWISSAKRKLENANASISDFALAINQEVNLNKSLTSAVPQYISISQYPVYKYISTIKDYSVGTKQEWLDAVAMSDFSKSVDAFDFKGITIHLTDDIDMENINMLPLCYNGKFNGYLNGHDYVFENINITIDTPRGPVGLIAWMAANRWVQNLGIATGKINVTGNVIHKSSSDINGNKVGGILGKSDRGLVRKCWAGISISTENYDNAGGIVGDGRSTLTMDGCFFIGKAPGYGVLGYGGNTAKVTNSISGAATGYAVQLHLNIGQGNEANYLKNVYAVGGNLSFNGMAHSTLEEALYKEQAAKRDAYNLPYMVLNAKEAAWKVNRGYQAQNLGDQSDIIFTVNEKGNVAFGNTENQIRRITMKCEGQADKYLYAAANSTVNLRYELDANYYALEGNYQNTTLKNNVLKLGNEDVEVRVHRNINRGDVNGDGVCGLPDALNVLRQIVGRIDTVALPNGDADGNGALGINDAVLLIRVYLQDENNTFVPGLPDVEDYIKVCSYNIKVMHYEASTDSTIPKENADAIRAKMQEVAQTLREIDADIVGLQEVDYLNNRTLAIDQVKWLAEELGYPYYLFTSTTGDYGTAVMSRFRILNSTETAFAGNVRENGHRLDGYEPRKYSRHELDMNNDGKMDFIFYNTHLGNFTPQQLQYMSKDLEADYDAGNQLVVTGDFNMRPHEMVGRFDTNKLTALNGGDDFNHFEKTTIPDYGNSIDNIIVSDNMEYFWDEARDCGTFEYLSKASDHSPLYSYIKLK